MKKIQELIEKIAAELREAESQVDNITQSFIKLKDENLNLKNECQKALFEVEKCLSTIESIETENGNHNN